MAAQTWDLTYYTSLVPGTGVGNTDSAAGDAATVHNDWAISYVSSVVSATGVGNTDSAGVGSAGTPAIWPIDYWDGVNRSTGVGNTTSTGVGAVDVITTSTWYDLTGSVSDAAAGAGNTISAGQDDGASVAGLPTPVITLNVQMPPGTVVGAYLRHEWIGSEVPVRGAGSYPGPVFAEAVVNARGEVAFTLPPESYIAWAADFPLRRRFFVITD